MDGVLADELLLMTVLNCDIRLGCLYFIWLNMLVVFADLPFPPLEMIAEHWLHLTLLESSQSSKKIHIRDVLFDMMIKLHYTPVKLSFVYYLTLL